MIAGVLMVCICMDSSFTLLDPLRESIEWVLKKTFYRNLTLDDDAVDGG